MLPAVRVDGVWRCWRRALGRPGTFWCMADRPTGKVTFLFTDVEGSTRLWEEQPDEMAAALARHDEILTTAIEGHGGYVFTTAGDSFSAAFQSALAAVLAALGIQQAMQAREEPGTWIASPHWLAHRRLRGAG